MTSPRRLYGIDELAETMSLPPEAVVETWLDVNASALSMGAVPPARFEGDGMVSIDLAFLTAWDKEMER